MGGVIAQRLDRRASGNAPVERQLQGLAVVGGLGAGHRRREIPLNHPWRETRFRVADHRPGRTDFLMAVPRPPGTRPRCHAQVLRQARHLDGPCAVRQALDEPAFLEAGNQPVDAGFGLQRQRILHFIKGRRDAMALKMAVDEQK